MNLSPFSLQSLKRSILLAIGILCLLCGAPLIGIGCTMYASNAYLQAHGESAEAVVDRVADNDVFISYEYNGTTYAGTLVRSGIQHYEEGDTVEIRFNPSNPGFTQPAESGRRGPSMIGAAVCVVSIGGILCACGAHMKSEQEMTLEEYLEPDDEPPADEKVRKTAA